MIRKITRMITAAVLVAALYACSSQGVENVDVESLPLEEAESTPAQASGIDYMVLVNKLNKLPDDWEENLETVHMTNSLGDDVEVEKRTYDAYLKLKGDLEKEGVYVDLDSSRRSVEEQQQIMDEFTEEYGSDYAAKTVATPGYSEHHTGLALDLYLIIDGKEVYLNEDMVQYPEIWAKIHEKLAENGFILRYLEDKEHITGYGYEPWHIRYLGDVDTAKQIMESGETLEEYLGEVSVYPLTVDYGTSELYTQEELKEAAIQAKCVFAGFDGCELKSLRYAGDECNTQENLQWLNEGNEGKNYTQVALFLTDFYVSEDSKSTLGRGKDYTDYEWWLAREEGSGWELLEWGY